MSEPIYSPGLEGIVAGETAVSSISPDTGLCYRGYPAGELVENASFDEVAFLLLHGDLPNRFQFASFQRRLAAARGLPHPLLDLLRVLPPAVHSMDVVRSVVSVLAHYDPETEDGSHEAHVRKAERLVAQIPMAVAAHYRLSRGMDPVPARSDLGGAGNFLYMLRGREASSDNVRALDASLILYAEHEFNASTFTARVVCSTLSDLHSAIVAAIGALKGPLHGGANEKVMAVLEAAGSPERAEAWVRQALARKERIMGFGHRIYKTGDVRVGVLKPYARQAAEAAGLVHWEETAEIVERILAEEKQLYPNVDWPAGRLYYALGLEVPLYTPIFVMSRVAGWSAHFIEQHEHNRLIRPRSRYTGPDVRHALPLGQRG
jgi:2-methylcitrate synthase/citrate synthase II